MYTMEKYAKINWQKVLSFPNPLTRRQFYNYTSITMAFCTTYRTILDRNIRHVYSERSIHRPVRRTCFVQYLDHTNGYHEEQLKPLDKFTARSSAYIPEYDIIIPKAPAFREMKASEVKRIVGRLSRPIQCQVTDFTCHKEATRQMKDICGPCELNQVPNIVPKKQLSEINERLRRPTTSHSNRMRMRPFERFDIFDINDSCTKAGSRPNSMLPRRDSMKHRHITVMWACSLISFKRLSKCVLIWNPVQCINITAESLGRLYFVTKRNVLLLYIFIWFYLHTITIIHCFLLVLPYIVCIVRPYVHVFWDIFCYDTL